MKSYQKMFLEGNRKKHKLCGNCGQLTHGLPDDIDEHANDLLDRLTSIGYFDGTSPLV